MVVCNVIVVFPDHTHFLIQIFENYANLHFKLAIKYLLLAVHIVCLFCNCLLQDSLLPLQEINLLKTYPFK